MVCSTFISVIIQFWVNKVMAGVLLFLLVVSVAIVDSNTDITPFILSSVQLLSSFRDLVNYKKRSFCKYAEWLRGTA